MIPYSITKKVIDATDIVEVVSEYVSLKKKGSSYFGLCPFHDDKNPSMSVSGEKKVFNCFSCNTKGNVIYFVAKHDNLTMEQATIKLAKRAGIKIDENITLENDKQTKLFNVMNEAYNFYRFYLHNSDEGQVALKYLSSRGINEEIIRTHKIGLAPSKQDYLHQALDKKNISNIDQIELGLVKDVSGTVHDIFRNRIMFSITNASGQIVGFSGRIYTKSDQAKYINSTDNQLFHKGEILYNYDLASLEARKKNQIFVFEGFMDVIACEKAGIKNAVATMGTAMTKTHVDMLLKLTKNIVLFFDGDEAGIHALKRSTLMLGNSNIIPNAVLLPDNLDPDEYITKYGVNKFNEFVLSHTQNAYLVLYNLAFKDVYLQDLASIEKFKNEMIDLINKTNSDVVKNYIISRLVQDLKIDEASLRSKIHSNIRDDNPYLEIKENKLDIKKPNIIKKQVRLSTSVIMAYDTIIKQAIYSKEALSFVLDEMSLNGLLRYPGSELSREYDLLYIICDYYNSNPDKEGMGPIVLCDIIKDKPNSLKFVNELINNRFILADNLQMLKDSIIVINNYFKKQDNIASYNATILSKTEEELKKNMIEFIEINKSHKKIIKEEDM